MSTPGPDGRSAQSLELAYPTHLRDEVDAYLERLRFSDDPMTEGLEAAMRYTLLAGGKRVRPVLALATARTLGASGATVLPLAAAIELIHALALIHDDLPALDDTDERRGRPANHRVHGEAVAILAADAMFAEAFHLLLTQVDAPADRVRRAAARVAAAAGTGGMTGGHTAALIEASVAAVLELVPGGDPVVVRALRKFAAELGLMFQLVGDLIDAETNQRPTLVLAGRRNADALADRCLARIESYLTAVPCDGSELLAIATFVRYRRP